MRNESRHFICRDQKLRIENADSMWTRDYFKNQEIVVPLKNQEGNYFADPATLDMLEGEGRVVVRYLDVNPNGSARDIAGIRNERGNVVGLMPHPEHAVDSLTGPTTEGLPFFTSVLTALVSA
jgi:phosphoribosylformylglycinamidine synthase